MKITENSGEIVIRQAPVGKWIVGGVLGLVFGVCLVWLLFFGFFAPRGYFEVSDDWFNTLLIFTYIGIVLAAVFEIKLISMICAPLTTVTVSQKTKSVDLLRQMVYGRQAERFYFFQVKKFKSYKNKSFFSSRYFLALVLANRKVIKLKIPTGDKQESTKFVRKLNKFIKIADPSEELAVNRSV